MNQKNPELLKPIELFESPAGWEELKSGEEVKMHRRWSPKVTSAVKAIHAFWIPHRIAQYRQMVGEKLH